MVRPSPWSRVQSRSVSTTCTWQTDSSPAPLTSMIWEKGSSYSAVHSAPAVER